MACDTRWYDELNPAQFETLFAGLDWRFVTQLDVTPPAAAE